MPGSSQHCCTQRLASAGTAISPGPAACRAALGRLSCQHAYMFSHPFMHRPHSALHSLAGSNGRASPNPRSVLLASAAEIQGSSASCEFMLHIGFVAMRQKVPHTAQIFLSIGAEQ